MFLQSSANVHGKYSKYAPNMLSGTLDKNGRFFGVQKLRLALSASGLWWVSGQHTREQHTIPQWQLEELGQERRLC